MKSKRSDFIVITDRNIPVKSFFFCDGTKQLILAITRKELRALAKGGSKVLPCEKKFPGRYIHLSPEIAFWISRT